MTFRSRDFPNAKRVLRAKFGKRTPKAKKPKLPWPATLPTNRPVTVRLPGFRMVNTLNARENWRTRGGRESKEKAAVRAALVKEQFRPTLPAVVGMCRVYSGRCKPHDDDGTIAAAKVVRDTVAEWLGRDDSPRSPILWLVDQRRGEFDGVEIVVVPVAELPKRQAVGDYLPKG